MSVSSRTRAVATIRRIRRVRGEPGAELLRFDGHVHGQRQHFELRRGDGSPQPQGPRSEALVDGDPSPDEVVLLE